MEYKITKIENIRKNVNDMVGVQWYFLAYVRVYENSTHRRYWHRRFVFMFDGDDIAEFYGDEDSEEYPKITKKMIKDYRDDIAWSCAESFIGYNKDIETVTKECNDTIIRYNDTYYRNCA